MDENPSVLKDTCAVRTLEKVAKTVLTRSALSVAVECMFSSIGLILNGKRYRLSDDKVSSMNRPKIKQSQRRFYANG